MYNLPDDREESLEKNNIYTSEYIEKLREQAIKNGYGYLPISGLIEFDKAVRASTK